MSAVNYRLELPTQWSIHPVFHIDLLTPYKETIMHGPNFTRPAPELIEGEEEYSIEKILDSQQFGRRRRLQYLVKWEGYPDSDNMWVDKDDIFADDKIREFKNSNPKSETHIRSTTFAKCPYPSAHTRSQLLYRHASSSMSSDGNQDLAYEYPVGAIADSPIPFSQENRTAASITGPVPIVDFTTLQPLSASAPVFSPQPVSASSSASNVANMFRQLRVHTPAPLTPDSQHAAAQATETFTISLTPARGGGDEAGSVLASGSVDRSMEALGTMPTTANHSQANSNGSATASDLRCCARCGEQQQYCHGHTPFIPNPTLDLPPAQPRVSAQGPIPANRVARFNLNRAQATALAARLIDTLEQNHEDPAEVPPAYDYQGEFARVLAEGLGLTQAEVTEGLGLHSGGGSPQGQNQGGRPRPVPDTRHPTNSQQVQGRRAAQRPTSPTPPGFEHNRGPAYIPFRIQENSREIPARYIRAHLDVPNPFVEGRLSLEGPTYHSEIHAAAIHNVDFPPPPITADILRLLHTDYMGHYHVDEALGELGDQSLIAEVNRYRRLERKRKGFQDSITRLEDQLFTTDVERCMCISRLEGARAMVCIQGEMQQNVQAFRLSLWSVERGRLP
jgi:hypothetical protein